MDEISSSAFAQVVEKEVQNIFLDLLKTFSLPQSHNKLDYGAFHAAFSRVNTMKKTSSSLHGYMQIRSHFSQIIPFGVYKKCRR